MRRHTNKAGSPIEEAEVLILGAGLAGLSAATMIGASAIVLERSHRPGGLVRTECFNGYWFDHVIHLLYFPDVFTEQRVKNLVGPDLEPCPPAAWVECSAGTARFPLQLHLATLDSQTVVDCLLDLIDVSFTSHKSKPKNFEEVLLRTFGQTMCDIFFFPYNRKVWKRPLSSLAASGFQWNIAPPELAQVLRGALNRQSVTASYNSAGWYPRPPRGAEMRGMEVLSRRLAANVANLRLQHTVKAIDLEKKVVMVRCKSGLKRFRFAHSCIATLPLPEIVARCWPVPKHLSEACARLRHNRVISAAFSIHGPRPVNRGHWRYYADESLSFTRLIYLHEFDPDCAPQEGWPLLAEVTEPAESPLSPRREVLDRIQADISRVGALPSGCRIIDAHLLVIDPAYVVFSPDDETVVEQAHAFLLAHGIIPVGRYGRWEYSSMGQVMRDGFSLGERISSEIRGLKSAVPQVAEIPADNDESRPNAQP